MGCSKSCQKNEIENNKETEISYNEQSKNKTSHPKKEQINNLIKDSLGNQAIKENQQNKDELPFLKDNIFVEAIENSSTDGKRINLLKKCQSHIRGMEVRRKMRIKTLKGSQTLNFKLLDEKELPISKEEITRFFVEYPKKETQNTKLIKNEPIMFKNNIIYYGEWDMNFITKQGRGIQIWPDGSYYKGYWENNKAEGKGEFKHSSGDSYIGNWHKNKRNGKGIYHSKKGMEYKGYWVNDKQEGKGKEVWKDGSSYDGNYLKGEKKGEGIMKWPNGCKYNGNFENGNMHGIGIFTFADNRKYDGYFVNNEFEGKGIFKWPNGDKYIGNFKNNKRHGYGTFTLADGRILKGMWKDGKQDGDFDIYEPKRRIWIKETFKKSKKEKGDKNENKIIFINEQTNQEDKSKKIEDNGFGEIDEIKKAEENKIDALDEEEF